MIQKKWQAQVLKTVLETVKKTPIMMKKKRVAKGAEVITQKEGEDRVKETSEKLLGQKIKM